MERVTKYTFSNAGVFKITLQCLCKSYLLNVLCTLDYRQVPTYLPTYLQVSVGPIPTRDFKQGWIGSIFLALGQVLGFDIQLVSGLRLTKFGSGQVWVQFFLIFNSKMLVFDKKLTLFIKKNLFGLLGSLKNLFGLDRVNQKGLGLGFDLTHPKFQVGKKNVSQE